MTKHFKCLGCGQTNAWSNRAGDGFCRTCFVTAQLEATITNRSDATVTAELTRVSVLKALEKHIRSPESAKEEPATIPFSEFDSPLSPFLREPDLEK